MPRAVKKIAMSALLVATVLFPMKWPMAAISVELAKKCRELAVKAHPPQPAGTTPYAAAEQDYFRECVAKGGNMEKNEPAGDRPPAAR